MKNERFIYTATFDRGDPLTFRNSNMALARDHAEYVAWIDNRTVTKVRRATPEEAAALSAELKT